MCLILFASHIHPDYPLVVAANRDEFHARPTRTAQWWEDSPDLLAGKDLSAVGTWLGVTRSGRLAAVTNYRDPAAHDPAAQSRGELTTNFLKQDHSAEDYQKILQDLRDDYNGYNLLFGTIDRVHYYSNRGRFAAALQPGIYGLSNHLLDTPWPKVNTGKQALSDALQQKDLDLELLWKLLADPSVAPDDQLPDTGISREWERTLSAIRIQGDHYGTRTSTLLLANKDGQVHFLERTFKPVGQPTEVDFNFNVNGQGSSAP